MSELLSWEELVPNKDIYRRATFSNHVLLHSINFFRIDIFLTKVLIQKVFFLEQLRFKKKLIFQKSTIPKCILFWRATFSEWLLFQKTCLSISSYCFRRATFSQHTFSENLLFHSYSSFHSYSYAFHLSVSN